MPIHFVMKKPLPKLMTLRFKGTTQRASSLYIPGLGLLEKSELKDLVQYLNGKHGTNITEGDVEQQIEQRLKGEFDPPKPSFKKWAISRGLMRE